MKVVRIIAIGFSVLIAVFACFLWYMGYFSKIDVIEKEEGGYLLAGKKVMGPYSKVGTHINTVEYKLMEMGINSLQSFGIYYDNPQTTPNEKCKSLVGCIITKNDLELSEIIKLNNLIIDSIPRTKAIIAEFPIKNRMSYSIGAMKVYPLLTNYLITKKYTKIVSFEIYDKALQKIIFVMQYQ